MDFAKISLLSLYFLAPDEMPTRWGFSLIIRRKGVLDDNLRREGGKEGQDAKGLKGFCSHF